MEREGGRERGGEMERERERERGRERETAHPDAACVLKKEVRTLIARAIVFRMRISTRSCTQIF